MAQLVRRCEHARHDGDPENNVARRGLVTPALPGLQAYREIVDRRRDRDGARCGPVTAEEDASRTDFRHIFWGLVDADGRTQFHLRRQSDPELHAARPACFAEPAAVCPLPVDWVTVAAVFAVPRDSVGVMVSVARMPCCASSSGLTRPVLSYLAAMGTRINV